MVRDPPRSGGLGLVEEVWVGEDPNEFGSPIFG